MSKFSLSSLGALALAFAAGVATAAPVQTLYVTDGDSARLATVNGSTATVSHTFSMAYPLAVRDTIWLGRYWGNGTAYEYTPGGVATGKSAAYVAVNAVDGATSATANYALGNAFSSGATVYSANTDWTGMKTMFNVYGSDLVGITFDSASGNLWVSDNRTMYQYTLDGALVSSFRHAGQRGSLAYEGATDTLWYVQNSSNQIFQYSKTGMLLDTVTVSGLSSNNWGAEFAYQAREVPEPASLGLIAIGIAGAAFVRRKKVAGNKA